MRGWDAKSEALFSYVSCEVGLDVHKATVCVRGNRRPAKFDMQLFEFRRQRLERLVHNLPDRPQRMILWNPL
jgi:hypothetical protein